MKIPASVFQIPDTFLTFVLPNFNCVMRKGIHPEGYRFVVFKDMSNGETFITRSAANTRESITMEDGKEYPLVKLEISNTSHPFYTGKMMLIDTAGRIDKFNKRYAKK
jgi:large subunit ribosomal protein L31